MRLPQLWIFHFRASAPSYALFLLAWLSVNPAFSITIETQNEHWKVCSTSRRHVERL